MAYSSPHSLHYSISAQTKYSGIVIFRLCTVVLLKYIILWVYHLEWPSRIFAGICDVLGNLVPFVQFKKREKHPCF